MKRRSLVPGETEITEAFLDFKHIVTIKEAAQHCGLPEHRVRYAYEAGYIVSSNIGRFVILSRSSVLKWFDKVKRLYSLE